MHWITGEQKEREREMISEVGYVGVGSDGGISEKNSAVHFYRFLFFFFIHFEIF